MLSDPFPQASTKPPRELGGTSAGIFMYVEDVDAVVEKAVDEGAALTMEVAEQFWGDQLRHDHGSLRPRVVDCGPHPDLPRKSRNAAEGLHGHHEQQLGLREGPSASVGGPRSRADDHARLAQRFDQGVDVFTPVR